MEDAFPVEMTRLSRRAQNKEQKEHDRRIRRMLIILLLLLLLLFSLALALLLTFFPELFRPQRGPIVSLFSIYGFDRPLAVSTDNQDQIYVSDTGNARLLVFDGNGDFVRRIGTTRRPKSFYGVYGTFVDNQAKRIYVADWSLRAVKVFSTGGKFLYQFPKQPLAKQFGSLGFSPFGLDIYKNRVYVTGNDGVYIFSKKGKLLEKWGQRGKDLDSFDYPTDIVVDRKDGTVYVADQLNRRVVALNKRGIVKWALGQPDVGGDIKSFFGLPRGLAQDREGRLFISDTFHHQIVVLGRNGELVSIIGQRGTNDAKFDFPEGLDFGAQGTLFVADRENNRIQALRIRTLPAPKKGILNKYRSFFKKANG